MSVSLPPNQVWNDIISHLPGTHLLQSWEWGHVKSKYGWQPHYALWSLEKSIHILNESDFSQHTLSQLIPDTRQVQAAALILMRSIQLRGLTSRINILYAPKGPLLDWTDNHLVNRVLHDLQMTARKSKAIFIKIDPDVRMGTGKSLNIHEAMDSIGPSLIEKLKDDHWSFSNEQIQFRNTVIIDLTPDEDTLLSQMKQKTRYNIRLAERRGVTIRSGDQADISMLYRMYAETSIRDGFTIREENYFKTVIHTFLENTRGNSVSLPMVKILIAEVNKEPVAAIVIFLFAGKAWYIYGMSHDAHREKMPNYLLQWEAIKLAKRSGCYSYDLWGAPDQFVESDPLWGVYRFKEGLGGTVVRHIGAWDYPVSPLLYHLYTRTLPRLLGIMRFRQTIQTRQIFG